MSQKNIVLVHGAWGGSYNWFPILPGLEAAGHNVFFTSNSGLEWVSHSYNMPRVPVIDLKIHNPTRKLIAGTYGLSAFSIDLDQNLLGDINYDGILNVLDVVLLVNLVLGNEYSDSADLNLDSDLSILDIVLLINIIL